MHTIREKKLVFVIGLFVKCVVLCTFMVTRLIRETERRRREKEEKEINPRKSHDDCYETMVATMIISYDI